MQQKVIINRAHLRNFAYLGLTVNLLQSTLAAEANIPPFARQFTDLPAPRYKILATIETVPSEDADTSFNQTQFTALPPPRKVGIITTIRTISPEDSVAPSNVIEWRNPPRDNPDVRNESWVNNNLSDTLTPVSAIPFAPTIQSIPDVKKRIIQDWKWKGIEVNEIPNGQISQPNPLIKERNRVDFTVARPQHYVDNQPHNQYNWPNPAPAWLIAKSHIFVRQIEPPDLTNLTFNQTTFVPAPKKWPVRDYIKLPSFIQLETIFPDGARSYELPQPRQRRIRQDWINARPSYYVEPSLAILVTQIYDNPVRRTKRLVVRVNTRFPQPRNLEKPFNEKMEWPNPVLRVKRAIPWDDHYVFDDNAPFFKQILDVPQRKRQLNVGWIRTPRIQVVSSADPFKQLIYPNPIIVKQQNKGLIVNLLQSTLEPAPGDIPFYENKWPNPLYGKRNYHEGWIQEVKKYYVEEPLQPNQYDWPIFRTIKRAHVGYIFSQKQESTPNFTSITFVPQRELFVPIDWIDDRARYLPDIEIIKPFNQIDWQNPRARVRITKDIIDWLDQYYPILPQPVGRIICLLADATEYELEAALELYDLDATIVIFDLEAGGNDCE